jgi:hypothetical protein
MLVGGVSALLLQMLHPLALAGVWDHSNFRDDMLGRFRRTARFVSATTFAPREQALAEIAKVNRIHVHIRGMSEEGVAYDATDPELLTWVHAAEVSSFLRSFMIYSGDTLSDAEHDRYFAETAEIATALGAANVPVTRREMEAYLSGMRAHLLFDDRTRAVRDAVRSAPAPNMAASVMRWPYLKAGFSILPSFAKQIVRGKLSVRGSHCVCCCQGERRSDPMVADEQRGEAISSPGGSQCLAFLNSGFQPDQLAFIAPFDAVHVEAPSTRFQEQLPSSKAPRERGEQVFCKAVKRCTPCLIDCDAYPTKLLELGMGLGGHDLDHPSILLFQKSLSRRHDLSRL